MGNEKYYQSLDFRWQQDVSGTIMFNYQTKESYRMNETAFAIWRKMDGTTLRELLGSLKETYPNVEESKLVNDLKHIVHFMMEKKMVYIEEESS